MDNPYAPISQTPWWCVNGHYNAHERAVCRYCDAPFSAVPDEPAAPRREDAAGERAPSAYALWSICGTWTVAHAIDGDDRILCADEASAKRVLNLLAALSTAEREREADLRMAWTIGACFGKEFYRGRADDYRNRSLRMTANECLGLTPDGQESVPSGGET